MQPSHCDSQVAQGVATEEAPARMTDAGAARVEVARQQPARCEKLPQKLTQSPRWMSCPGQPRWAGS